MTFGELKELVEELEAEGASENDRVIVMTQSSYPFENEITGWCVRSDFEDEDDCDDEDEDEAAAEAGKDVRDEHRERDWSGHFPSSRDIVLLEGRQLCYGSKAAWSASRR